MPSFSTDERQLLYDSLQDYFQRHYTFEHFRQLTASGDREGFSRADWAQYGKLGWLGVALPESAGGSDGGLTELGIVMAAAGGALALEPLLATTVLSAGLIADSGSPGQQAQLSDFATGSRIAALCHYEPTSGYARDHIEAIAKGAGDDFVIDGEKSFTLHADAADTLVITARLGGAGGPLGAFLVAADSAGIARAVAPALDGRKGAAVAMSGVKVPATALLGETDEDRSGALDRALDRGAIAVCAEAAGAMTAVTDQTVEYLKQRQQFGQPLSKFQVLQHRLVDMSIAAEEARAATHAALQAVDDGEADAQEKIWKAKVQTARSARFVGGQAIQLHGGMGMTDELAIGHYYKRLTMCETLFGDGEWYLARLAEKTSA